MNLPNYFLADLPEDAVLTAAMIRDACHTLKSNRSRYLLGRPIADLTQVIAALAEDWLDPENPFRQRALALGPAVTGFPVETLAAGLDALFSTITRESLERLIRQDLGHLDRLEVLAADADEPRASRFAVARGPELLGHITAGSLPNPPITSLILGLLTRSAQFMKCASGTSFLPRLFAHSLHEIEPKLAACIEIAEWKGGTEALEQSLFAETDCLVAMGSDATINTLRRQVPPGVRFLGYGQRVSFGYVAQEMLTHHALPRIVARAAQDVIAWNQLGCLSPHVIYVEAGGRNPPERFAELLAIELAACEQRQPRGMLPTADAATIATRRAFYEVRAAHSSNTLMWLSPGSTAWTVVYESEPRFLLSCLNRFIHVKAVVDVEEALRGVDEFRGRISTVGLAASGSKEQLLASRFARGGIPRVCPLGSMQRPPLAWRHDGRPALGDLVTWTDWESSPSYES